MAERIVKGIPVGPASGGLGAGRVRQAPIAAVVSEFGANDTTLRFRGGAPGTGRVFLTSPETVGAGKFEFVATERANRPVSHPGDARTWHKGDFSLVVAGPVIPGSHGKNSRSGYLCLRAGIRVENGHTGSIDTALKIGRYPATRPIRIRHRRLLIRHGWWPGAGPLPSRRAAPQRALSRSRVASWRRSTPNPSCQTAGPAGSCPSATGRRRPPRPRSLLARRTSPCPARWSAPRRCAGS